MLVNILIDYPCPSDCTDKISLNIPFKVKWLKGKKIKGRRGRLKGLCPFSKEVSKHTFSTTNLLNFTFLWVQLFQTTLLSKGWKISYTKWAKRISPWTWRVIKYTSLWILDFLPVTTHQGTLVGELPVYLFPTRVCFYILTILYLFHRTIFAVLFKGIVLITQVNV